MELVKLLISHRADLMVEYGERTAVEFAMDQDQLEIADYLKGMSQHCHTAVLVLPSLCSVSAALTLQC